VATLALTGASGAAAQSSTDTIEYTSCSAAGVCIYSDFLNPQYGPGTATENYFLPGGNTFYYGGAKEYTSNSVVVTDAGNVLFGGFESANILPSFSDPTIVNNQVSNIAGINKDGGYLEASGQYLTMTFEVGTEDYVGTLGFEGDGNLALVDYLCVSGPCPVDEPGYVAPTGVPEPASWALLMAGIGATGAARRAARRRERRLAA
jgi:hypothetical protein